MKKIFAALVVSVVLSLGSGLANAAGDYLVYRSGGSQYSLETAMDILGFSYDVVDASTITAADVASHKALIVGWSAGGYDMSGLTSDVMDEITGNKLLTGHDADFHTAAGIVAASTFMDRAVLFAGGSPGNPGFLGFPIYDTDPFSYLPDAWGVEATDGFSYEVISGITADGNDSGLYSGLSLASLSYWYNSYHAVFTDKGILTSFELGSLPTTDSIVTIGTTVTPIPGVPEPATMLLLGLGLMGVVGMRRKLKK